VSDARFLFRGDLATTPLAEALQTIHHYRVPGVLSATRDGIEKKIFVWNGDVIFATSGDRADSLGDYVLKSGRITQEAFDRSIELLLLSGGEKRHGEILVEMGILSDQALFDIVSAQVRSILFSVFDWEDGDYTFQVGQYRTHELIQLNIPARQAILEGVKQIRNAKRLVSLLGPSYTIFDPAYVAGEIADIGLNGGELRLLAHVNGVKTLKELIATGPADAEHNAKLMYAFFALKLISRREMTARSIKKIQWKTEGGSFAPEG